MRTVDPLGVYLLPPAAVALAERQRRYAAETLHDGPMQEFTAVLLGLGQLRHGLDSQHADRLTELEIRLRDTVAALRAPASVWRSDLAAPELLDRVLRSWVEGPLADRLDLTVRGAPLDRRDVAGVVGLVQFVLHELDPVTPVRSAVVNVEGLPAAVSIQIRAVPAQAPDAHQAGDTTTDETTTDETAQNRATDETAAAARLRELVVALRADASRSADAGWTVRLRLPRRPDRTPGPTDQLRERLTYRLRERLRRRAD